MAKLTIETIKTLTEQEINERWSEVASVLAEQRIAPVQEPWRDESEPYPLSLADVARMSEADINKHWTRVQQALERSTSK